MPGKVRVHELAKELGRTPRQFLRELNEVGEFVKSAASTLEGPSLPRLGRNFRHLPPRSQ